MLRRIVAIAVGVAFFGTGVALIPSSAKAQTADVVLVQPEADEFPLEKKNQYDRDYRYDFSDRHFTFGINVGGGFAAENTMNAFPLGGTVTPYFKGAFGDGNALQLDVTIGYHNISGPDYNWLFFRTPALPGSTVEGFLGYAAPNLQFRYELDLSSTISKRSPVLFWGGLGLGAFITYGEASLLDNDPKDVELYNKQVFFDFVPTGGLKVRLGEFGYAEVGVRQHLILPLASKMNYDDTWQKGKPFLIQEFWIGGARLLDTFVGFSYDFK